MDRKRWTGIVGVLVAVVSLALIAAACGGGGGDEATPTEVPAETEPAAETPAEETPVDAMEEETPADAAQTPAAEATTVDVSLTEFAVDVSQGTVPAGTVTFSVMNDGAITHNLRVIRTDAAPDELPVEGGQVPEDDVVAASGDLSGGDSEEVTVDLEPGNYVLICNIPGHYQAGMRVAFTVE